MIDCCSVAKSCLTLCDPIDCSTPGLPVQHQLLEFTQLMSIEVAMLSNHLILCHPLPLPSVFPSLRVFSSESAICINGQNIGASASASVRPMNIQGSFLLGLTALISLLSKGLSGVFSSTTVLKHQFFSVQPSLWYNPHIRT